MDNTAENTKDKVKSERRKFKFKFLLVVQVMILFSLGLLVMLRFTEVTELGRATNSLNIESERMEVQNRNISVRIERSTNLSQIRADAESLYRLHPPNRSQIVYIRTTINDRIDITESEEAEEQGIFGRIFEWIKGFFEV